MRSSCFINAVHYSASHYDPEGRWFPSRTHATCEGLEITVKEATCLIFSGLNSLANSPSPAVEFCNPATDLMCWDVMLRWNVHVWTPKPLCWCRAGVCCFLRLFWGVLKWPHDRGSVRRWWFVSDCGLKEIFIYFYFFGSTATFSTCTPLGKSLCLIAVLNK